MPTKLFVNLPVKDLSRSRAFFTGLGLEFFGQAEDMASVIISAASPTSTGITGKHCAWSSRPAERADRGWT